MNTNQYQIKRKPNFNSKKKNVMKGKEIKKTFKERTRRFKLV